MTRTKGKNITLHSFLMPKEKGYVIDHINRNRLDNRRCNLRYASMRVNAINASTNNSVGRVGVYRSKSGRYYSRISFYGKKLNLGTYDTFDEAVIARERAEEKYHKPIIEKETHT